MPGKSVIVIGSGFAGLSAASFMAREGWKVTVLEKNSSPGGRARQWKEKGFTFDMGPSFYWMPGVFERYFQQFGKKVSDYYSLERLDPSYRIYWHDQYDDIPADKEKLYAYFESLETGSSIRLKKYLNQAAEKYKVGMEDFVYKPGLSLMEFMNLKTLRGALKLDIFSSIRKHIASHFKHEKLRQLMEFPVLFLGALPQDTPALYSLMNYADMEQGTWYPQGGMYAVVNAMHQLAVELGVEFRMNEEVISIETNGKKISKVVTPGNVYTADAVISGADYQHTEKKLLAKENRNYSDSYWEKRTMAPSCLMYYVGLNKKLKHATHHSLFFDVPFDKHGEEIYRKPSWPTEPLFYVSVSSVTDNAAAPEGYENLVFLVPVAAGLEGDTELLRDEYFKKIVSRMEKMTGESIADAIIFRKSYSVQDFTRDYHSFKGNAYGLANTLRQTAVFRPSCRSKKVSNLFFTGQLTVPGPGVPPSLISGEVVAKELIRSIR